MLVAFSSLCKFCKSAFPVRNFVQSFKLFFKKNSVSRWELLEEAKATLALSLFLLVEKKTAIIVSFR